MTFDDFLKTLIHIAEKLKDLRMQYEFYQVSRTEALQDLVLTYFIPLYESIREKKDNLKLSASPDLGSLK
eukprot:CAMPEP_0170499118 /NCGR_PEP_ID=MMETSP0208-20121228/30172_1 /TAXON_ID=197538 /ORGANISM="Strombidium inclinatum, Strain S3" /LENGTH=69 /DNA_ID=CAMNT_0010776545 /DNA_START=1032 /DNA_END=1241 /DNA_ORIENTATION=+